MENLRWILLIAGLVLIGLVYWNSRRRAADDTEQPPIDAPDGPRGGRVRVPPSFATEVSRGNSERREPRLSDEDLNDPLFAPTPGLRMDESARLPGVLPVAEQAAFAEPKPEVAVQAAELEPAVIQLGAHTVFTRLDDAPVVADPPPEAADNARREADFPPPIDFEALDFAELRPPVPETAREAAAAEPEADLYILEPEPEPELKPEPEPKPAPASRHHSTPQPEQHFDAEPQAIGNVEEKLVVLHVVAGGEGQIVGTALRQLFAERGYQHGEMDIFHSCYEKKTVFSIVNLVEPGHFEPEKMNDSFRTPGVTLFMRLPGPLPADVAFDVLVSEAQQMARDLGGEARDADHSTLTRQRIQSLREEVQSYIHRNRLGATS